jgi:polysaccharide biosynthesis/export protein
MRKITLLILIIFLSVPAVFYSALAGDNKELSKEYYERGDTYLKEGKYQEAQAEYQKALELLGKKEEAKEVSLKEPLEVSLNEPVAQGLKEERAVQRPHRTQQEYLIDREDVLYISVWQNADLSQEAIVRPDGMVSFPLVGDIQAEGLSISELDGLLTERLKEFVKFPEVSISIKKMSGKKVIVLGEVLKPAVYSVNAGSTILEVISMAGGFSKDAVSTSVVLIRGGFTKPHAERINLSRALAKGDLSRNIVMQAEDIVFVPRRFIADVSYVANQILGPLSQGIYVSDRLQNPTGVAR